MTPLQRYEARSDRPLLVLSLCFVVLYAVQVAVADLPPALRTTLDLASWIIWAVFAGDLAARIWLAQRRMRYLATHLVDVIIVVLPALRSLRVLRIFTAGGAVITRGGRLSLLRSTEAIAAATSLLVLIAALAALDAERDAPSAHITDLADALWWAATTVTTVGYGDTYPVTGTGRLVAAALMLVGISLVGLITATLATWFVTQIRGATETAEAQLAIRLAKIESALVEIHAAVLADKPPPVPAPGHQQEPASSPS